MVSEGMRQGPQSAILWYAMLRAADRFYDATGRLPGVAAVTVSGVERHETATALHMPRLCPSQVKEDTAAVAGHAKAFAAAADLPDESAALLTDDHAAEM